MNAYDIQKAVKDGLSSHITREANGDVWNLSQKINAMLAEEIKGIKSAVKREEKVRTRGRMLTDDERQEELTRFLDAKLLDGTLTAAELGQFKDIYGLKNKERDIIIQTINFADADLPIIKGDLD